VNQPKTIIAIDGNSSCGKSTFAKKIAAELKFSYVDTGAMYRAVTLAAMEKGLFDRTGEPPVESVGKTLEDLDIALRYNQELERTEIFLNGRMVEDRIRELDVSSHVSYIAAIPAVRRKMVEYQRSLGEGKGIVMDGRDIGTVVFPAAELKIFLTASEEVRARRRFDELRGKGMKASLEEVRQNISKRDRIDSTRSDSPLKKADDAVVLDNSDMTVEQQMDWFRGTYQKIIERIYGASGH
jgi:cytidylate kinase